MLATLGDLELFEAWCDGDQAAGKRLFERHYPSVMRYFMNKAPRDHEDLTQRTFLACVTSRDNFRRASSFRTFVFGIARNILHRWLRERARHDDRLDFTGVSAADLAPGPTTVVTKKREQALVLEGLRRIPVHYQEVLELHYWEELPGSAIAEVVGITEHNVRNRLRRAKLALAEALAELGEDPTTTRRISDELDVWARSINVLAG